MTIRQADESDLPALHALLSASLDLDRFSKSLLAEKLFRNPRPAELEWRTWVAESRANITGMLQSVIDRRRKKAYVGLFAVDATQRRRGIATALLDHARRDWAAGVVEGEVLAIPGNYFTPGLDPRYTAALSFLERRGFERFKDCVNLRADLAAAFDTRDDEARLAGEGVEIRRATIADSPLLDAYFGEHFGDDWRLEAGLALAERPSALHLAVRAGRMIAFSAHSTQNREWGFFGPMGTAPECRGLGIGRVLLRLCLNDLRHAGHKTAVIPWVGPIAFYQQWCGARVERVFWRYRLNATTAR